MKDKKLSLLQQNELVKSLEERILKGFTYSEIINELAIEYGQPANYINLHYDVAKKNIVENTSRDLSTLIDTHIFFYEKIYQYFDTVNNTAGLLKTLTFKEKLLGLHREDTLVEINNTTNVQLSIDEKYDFTKLSKKKQERLQELMKKTARIKKIV